VMSQIAAKIETIQAGVYNVHTKTIINDGQANEAQGVVYHSVLHGSRRDIIEDGRIVLSRYMLPGKKLIVTVNHLKKEYVRTPLSKAAVENSLAGQIDVRHWLDTMAAEGKKRASEVEFLGKKKMDGREVIGFALDKHGLFGKRFPASEGFMRLWVDAKEHLPVLMEIEYTLLRMPLGGGRYGKFTVSVISRDFQWDIKLGPDTFEPDIPQDYTLAQPTDSDAPAETSKKAAKTTADGPDALHSETQNGP